jgi:hypothetical protein
MFYLTPLSAAHTVLELNNSIDIEELSGKDVWRRVVPEFFVLFWHVSEKTAENN